MRGGLTTVGAEPRTRSGDDGKKATEHHRLSEQVAVSLEARLALWPYRAEHFDEIHQIDPIRKIRADWSRNPRSDGRPS